MSTSFLRLPDQSTSAAGRGVQPPNDAKSINVLVLDRSGSMTQEGKWSGLMDGLTTLFDENRDNGSYFMRVYFEVNRKRDPDFFPAARLLDDIRNPRLQPHDDRTAFYDAGCRAVRYLLDGLRRYPESGKPNASLVFLTDGLDNESRSGSKDALRTLIVGLLAELCPDHDYANSKVMIVYWAFGDGSEGDRARHLGIAKELGIPDCWVRYSVGNREALKKAGGTISSSIDSMTRTGRTEIL